MSIGVVDWAEAEVGPFGVSLVYMEGVLGIQTGTHWHFHPNHYRLRECFWEAFYKATGYVSEDDRHSIRVARLFGVFREYGCERKDRAISYLSTLCLI